jgi:hypothetical protein
MMTGGSSTIIMAEVVEAELSISEKMVFMMMWELRAAMRVMVILMRAEAPIMKSASLRSFMSAPAIARGKFFHQL